MWFFGTATLQVHDQAAAAAQLKELAATVIDRQADLETRLDRLGQVRAVKFQRLLIGRHCRLPSMVSYQGVVSECHMFFRFAIVRLSANPMICIVGESEALTRLVHVCCRYPPTWRSVRHCWLAFTGHFQDLLAMLRSSSTSSSR